MTWNEKKLGIVRLLVHKCPDMAPYEYEVLESDYFSYDFSFENVGKSRPYEDWMSELINEADHYEFYEDIFKNIKQPEFYAEIIAEIHVSWGYTGEYDSEYDEECWFENERFQLLTDKDIKEYNEFTKFKENSTIEEWPDDIAEGSNSDLDTRIFFKDDK